MSKYEEMSGAAVKGREKELQYRERCHNCLLAFLNGFMRYCEIPPGQVQCLRWNKQSGDESEFSTPIAGAGLAPSDAIEFDQQTRDFVVGIRLLVGDPHVRPRPWAFFPLYVYSGDDQYLTLRIGRSGKRHRIDFVDSDGWTSIYEEVIQGIKDALSNPAKAKTLTQKIGFSAGEET
jgi:hypothetical protein